jgi:hypothetical protein
MTNLSLYLTPGTDYKVAKIQVIREDYYDNLVLTYGKLWNYCSMGTYSWKRDTTEDA